MTKKIGLFGGSFDPIHFGHLNLAIQLLEIYSLDEVLFCPSFCSPFKTSEPPKASPEDRLAMLYLGLDEILQLNITTLEIDRGGISYTIDTVRALQSSAIQLHLLLSDETADHLQSWKEADALLQLAPPLIGSRRLLPGKKEKTQVFEISSTEIRARLKKGLYCGHLVPAKVLEYIKDRRIYD